MKPIGVTGIVRSVPVEVPLTRGENTGNMLHGAAPLEMFPNAYIANEPYWRQRSGLSSFRDFVNRECSHLIITAANLFRVNNYYDDSIKRYKEFSRMLNAYDVPIVIFGLGAQSESLDLSSAVLPKEAIDLIRLMEDRCVSISVRGEFTAGLFRKYGTGDNVYVTGCPSFFSKPNSFETLREHMNRPARGRVAVSGTYYRRAPELALVKHAVKSDAFHVEPVYKWMHQFHLDASISPNAAVIPDELQGLLEGEDALTRSDVVRHFKNNYRFFRDPRTWEYFNREYVRMTIGSRFHVNMASILAGRSALWLVHDSRTREMASALSLPSVELDVAASSSIRDLESMYDPVEMFDNLSANFRRFNRFLESADLPATVR